MYSLTLQAFWTFLAWVILWPLYHHCLGAAEQHFLLMLALLLLLKVANLLASWQESRFAHERTRLVSVSFRWVATTALISLQFLSSILWASGAASAAHFRMVNSRSFRIQICHRMGLPHRQGESAASSALCLFQLVRRCASVGNTNSPPRLDQRDYTVHSF